MKKDIPLPDKYRSLLFADQHEVDRVRTDLALLSAKVPFDFRHSFIDGIKAEGSNKYNPEIVDRLLVNIDKIDWHAYLNRHTDIAQNGYNPIVHYIYYGWKEHRELTILPQRQYEINDNRAHVLSCRQLRNGLVYENGSLYSCCAVNCGKRPFLTKVNEDGSFNINEVANTRKQIERELNTPGANPVCSDCPLLEYLPECSSSDEEDYYVCKNFNIGESHHCNFRCIYCVFNKKHMCNERRRVTMEPIIKFLLKNNLLAHDAHVSVAGGEPLLMPDFEESIDLLLEPSETAITVNTNLSVWSDALAKALHSDRVLIRSSIDAGTPETFAHIKGKDLFWKVVENTSRYACINYEQVILKYICMKENCNDKDLLGMLTILKSTNSKLLIDFDYYTPPNKEILNFAARFKALANISGVDVSIRYDAEYNWPQSIHMRKKLDAYGLLYLNRVFRLSSQKFLNSSTSESHVANTKGWVDVLTYNKLNGLKVQGWAWDHFFGAPKNIRVYKGNSIIFSGKTNYVRLDIEAGAKAGFDFNCQQNAVLNNIMANEGDFAVYVTFDGSKWDKLPVAPGAATK